jgi:hypothetical protein
MVFLIRIAVWISLSKLQMLIARACPQGIIDLKKYQMNVKGMNLFLFNGGKNMNHYFLVYEILNMVRS